MDAYLDKILVERFGEYVEPNEVTKLKNEYYEKIAEANEIRKARNEKLSSLYQLETRLRK